MTDKEIKEASEELRTLHEPIHDVNVEHEESPTALERAAVTTDGRVEDRTAEVSNSKEAVSD